MARRGKNNDINGLLLVDKPAGMTSHDVVGRIRRLAGTRRVGHTGTLDPDATGLLPITLGHCTKLANFLILDEKIYQFDLKLGVRTTTDDASGEPVAEADPGAVSEAQLARALDAYRGVIWQRPPRFSAIRVNGRRAYDLAREGVEFELEPRQVEVKRLELLTFDNPDASLEMHCTSGTYVRSLVRDVGEDLGVHAHTTAIRRTRVGAFLIDQAHTLEQLEQDGVEAHLLTAAQMMRTLPAVPIDAEGARAWSMGQRVIAPVEAPQAAPQDVVAVFDEAGALLGVGLLSEPRGEGSWLIAPDKVLNAR